MISQEEKFCNFLKLKGLKFTPERKTILKEIFSFHSHFDVDKLYDKLREQKEHISRATIYRTLPLLVGSNLISEALRCEGKISYEHIYGHEHHDHMICIKCGKIIEFRNENIEKLQNEICKKYGFKAVEYRLGIRGYCNKCSKRSKKERNLYGTG